MWLIYERSFDSFEEIIINIFTFKSFKIYMELIVEFFFKNKISFKLLGPVFDNDSLEELSIPTNNPRFYDIHTIEFTTGLNRLKRKIKYYIHFGFKKGHVK